MTREAARLTGVTGGEVVVAALALHDVGVVFGIPGTHNLSVFDALTRYGIRTVATTHEQGAGYAADGYARTSGRPGVAVVTSGPAVYNAATAVAQAYSDSIPMLLVSPGMPRDLPVGGPGTRLPARGQGPDRGHGPDRRAVHPCHHAPADRRRRGRGLHRVHLRTPSADPPRGSPRPARRHR